MLELIKEWGTLLGAILAAGTCGGAMFVLGQTKNAIEFHAKRMKEHSADINRHDLTLVRLELLPEQMMKAEERRREDLRTAEERRLADVTALNIRLDQIHGVLLDRG